MPQITDMIHVFVCVCVANLVPLFLFLDHVTVVDLIQCYIVLLTRCVHVQCLHT